MVTPPDTPFDLHLPAGTATLFEQRVALVPESHRDSWRYHAVAAGDTLDSVALEYRVTAGQLATANQLDTAQSIAGLEALIVPVAPVAAPSLHTKLYTTRRGDTLVTIADRFGVSLSELRRWNGIPSGIHVEPNRKLHVAEPAPVTHAASSSRRRRTGSVSAAAATHAAGHAGVSSGSKPAAPKSAHSGITHEPAGSAAGRSHSHAAGSASGAKSSVPHKPGSLAKASPQ
jgi:membrane-bound lytic murein transglycosylase D